MAHNYFERREQPKPKPGEHTRKYCEACRREWVEFVSQVGPSNVCPGCGNADIGEIAVNGEYDSTTDPADIARALLGVSQEKLDQEHEARQRLIHVAEIDGPPPCLLASVDENYELVGATSGQMPVPTQPSPRRSFAPELD